MPAVYRAASAMAVLLSSVLAFAGSSSAQIYPARSIRLIVPYPPGGMSDSLARVVMPRLGEVLGQQIVVESKPGAGGNLEVPCAS